LKGTILVIKGNERYRVSQIATQIREFRVPDAYKGKGIKKDAEILILKKVNVKVNKNCIFQIIFLAR
jgi:large subunit ribosomal protein L6